MGSMEHASEADRQATMAKLEEMQVKDMLRMFNGLVERCFSECVSSFRSKALTGPEETCVNACAEKYLVGKTPALAIVGNPTAVPDVKSAGWACVDAEGNPLKEE